MFSLPVSSQALPAWFYVGFAVVACLLFLGQLYYSLLRSRRKARRERARDERMREAYRGWGPSGVALGRSELAELIAEALLDRGAGTGLFLTLYSLESDGLRGGREGTTDDLISWGGRSWAASWIYSKDGLDEPGHKVVHRDLRPLSSAPLLTYLESLAEDGDLKDLDVDRELAETLRRARLRAEENLRNIRALRESARLVARHRTRSRGLARHLRLDRGTSTSGGEGSAAGASTQESSWRTRDTLVRAWHRFRSEPVAPELLQAAA